MKTITFKGHELPIDHDVIGDYAFQPEGSMGREVMMDARLYADAMNSGAITGRDAVATLLAIHRAGGECAYLHYEALREEEGPPAPSWQRTLGTFLAGALCAVLTLVLVLS